VEFASCVVRPRSRLPSPTMSISIWCWTTSADASAAPRETDEERTDRETVIADLLEGQYSNPIRVIAFNTAEKSARTLRTSSAAAWRSRARIQFPSSRNFWIAISIIGRCSCRCP
jgi:hypothetical protein